MRGALQQQVRSGDRTCLQPIWRSAFPSQRCNRFAVHAAGGTRQASTAARTSQNCDDTTVTTSKNRDTEVAPTLEQIAARRLRGGVAAAAARRIRRPRIGACIDCQSRRWRDWPSQLQRWSPATSPNPTAVGGTAQTSPARIAVAATQRGNPSSAAGAAASRHGSRSYIAASADTLVVAGPATLPQN